MSAPAPKRHAYNDCQEAELARWPGVTWTREHRGKHYALVLTFRGLSRFVIYPTSPGDSYRGSLNHVRDIRGTLSAMGATRLEVVSRNRPTGKRSAPRPVVEPVRLAAQDGTRLGRNPFEALSGFKTRPRGWARIRAYFAGGVSSNVIRSKGSKA